MSSSPALPIAYPLDDFYTQAGRALPVIEALAGDADLEGVLEVERESFSSPWTREMYAWELQNQAVCHIDVVRVADTAVAGFCSYWIVFDEVHINNVAILPRHRGHGLGTALLRHVFENGRSLGAAKVTLEVRGRERMIDSPDEDLLNCRFSTRAGFPATTSPSATSLMTTAPMPTKALLPIFS